MRVDEPAEILRRLEACRVELAATITSLEQAEESVKSWATQPPAKEVVEQVVNSLQKEMHAVRSFEEMVNEFHALPPTVIVRSEGASEPTSQGGPSTYYEVPSRPSRGFIPRFVMLPRFSASASMARGFRARSSAKREIS